MGDREVSYSVNIPDFTGTLARGEQMHASRLQMLAQRQALEDAASFRGAAADILPQLGTAEGAARLSLLSRLAGSGLQGAQMALPLMQQERQAAEFQRMLGAAMGGGAAPPAADPVAPAPVGARGEAPAAVSQGIAARAALDPNSPTYAQDIMRVNDGVVARTMPGQAPAAPAARNGLPSPQALFAMAASGNPRAIDFVRTVGPLVARESPNFAFQDIGGVLYAINPQNPTQRVAMGPAGSGPPLERIRQPDGSERLVPRPDAAGTTSAPAPVDQFGRANTLRDEFTRLTGDYRVVRDAFSNIETAARSQTGAGDMSMLYSFVKLLDPTSVVRESEFATAAASGSYGERIQGAVQRIISGERLPDSLRNAFLAEAQNIYRTQTRTYQQTEQTYRDLATRNQIDPANVVLPFAPQSQPAQVPMPGGIPGPGGIGTAEPPPRMPPPPQRGEVRDGYRFRGGDPADRNSWERVR